MVQTVSVIKCLNDALTQSATHCTLEGVFPGSWGKSNCYFHLQKKGDKSLLSNHRPVSLLSCCGKLLERIIFKHRYNLINFFFMSNDLIYKYQSAGFLPKHSTTYRLIDIYHHICQAIDRGQLYCIVFCDISKDFDRVWHKGLLLKNMTFVIVFSLG